MKKVLITGADGFIGRYLREELDKRGQEYLCICQKKTNNIEEEKSVIADITEYEQISKVFERVQPDVVVHLAAIASVTYANTIELYRVNVLGTENVLKATKTMCKNGTRFILISSAGVYGNQSAEYYTESLPFNPINHYSCTKMVDEVLSRQYTDNLDIKIVRPFTIIGKGQTQGFFVAKLVEAFKKRQQVIEVGNIESLRDYVDVEYCAYILAELICREKVEEHILNICTGVATSGKEVIEILEEITDFHPQIVISDKFVRENEIWRLVGDPKKLSDFLKDEKKYKTLDAIISGMLV